jgi:MFS family permease
MRLRLSRHFYAGYDVGVLVGQRLYSVCLANGSRYVPYRLISFRILPFLTSILWPPGFFLSPDRSHGAHEKSSETEALVGFWTGNLVSVFFITQFFTSLLWSSVADKYGRRLVLVVSLLGSALCKLRS